MLHWPYFRANGPLWSQVVMWTSGVGIVVAITGLWLGIDRLRLRRRNRAASITPFRGWMAWHHLAGIVGGVFLLTWIFSGWLSMGPPVPWERPFDPLKMQAGVSAYAGNTEARFPVAPGVLISLAPHRAVEATFDWALGQPRIELKDAATRSTIIDARTGTATALDEAALITAAPQLIADAHLIASQRLEREDAYWYSRRTERALPVLRFGLRLHQRIARPAAPAVDLARRCNRRSSPPPRSGEEARKARRRSPSEGRGPGRRLLEVRGSPSASAGAEALCWNNASAVHWVRSRYGQARIRNEPVP